MPDRTRRKPSNSRQVSKSAGSQRHDASRLQRPATERTLALLATLAAAGRPLSLKELALTHGLAIATVFRHCRRLEAEGYLVREGASRRYALGVRLMRLGMDIVRASGPTRTRHDILAELVGAIGETCNLTALGGNDVLYLDRVETSWPLRLTLEPGSRVPIHCTASGKLFLATMPKDQRERLLSTLPLEVHSPNTIVDTAELTRDLQRTVRRGFSTDNEEFLAGLAAVAVPVRDRQGAVIAAVACHAPVARLDLRQLVAEVPRLEAAASKIARTFE